MTDKSSKKALAIGFTMGAELIVLVLAGLAAGYHLGPYITSAELGAAVGCFIGFFIWIWRALRTSRKMEL